MLKPAEKKKRLKIKLKGNGKKLTNGVDDIS